MYHTNITIPLCFNTSFFDLMLTKSNQAYRTQVLQNNKEIQRPGNERATCKKKRAL